MYPAIKVTTAAAPSDWGWNRTTTRDIIRTLCWDRVRSQNRRIRSTGRELKKSKPVEKPTPTKNASRYSTNDWSTTKAQPSALFDASDDDIRPVPARVPKTIPRARIPVVITKERPAPIHTKTTRRADPPTSPAERYHPLRDMSSPIAEESQDAQRLPDLAFTPEAAPDDTFNVKIGRKKHIFAKDIDYEEFDNAVQSVLTV